MSCLLSNLATSGFVVLLNFLYYRLWHAIKFKLADLETQLNLQIVNKTWLPKQYSSFPKDELLDQTLLFTIFTTTNTR